MRGILFTEYLDFAANQSSEADVEEILYSLKDKISGSYTSVGNYSFEEFAHIHIALAEHLNRTPNEIAEQFGEQLLQRFSELFPQYFEGVNSGLDFLDQVGSHIHVEVKKLYPDACPPEIILTEDKKGTYSLTYRSQRPLAAVARGLTNACLNYFKNAHKIVDETSSETHDGNHTIFKIQIPV